MAWLAGMARASLPVPQRGKANEVPEEEGEQGDRHYAVGEVSGNGVGEFLDRGFAGLGSFHQGNDLGQGGVFARAGGAEGDRAGLVQSSGRDLIPRLLQDGHRFTCQHGLIHSGLSCDHFSIYRNLVPRQHLQPLTYLDSIDRHLNKFSTPQKIL